jgi:multiple sugar transport system ATP-binding protein
MPQRAVSAAIRCVVDVVEPLGSEIHVHLRSGAHLVTARMGPETSLRPQQEMNIVLDFRKVKFFDPETEQRIEAHRPA